MAHEMFGDVGARRPSRTRFRRVLTAVSIVLHAIVISGIVVVQLFAVGALPVPHRPLIVEELRLAQLVEVPLPPSPPRPGPSNLSQVPANLAPIVEPQAITPEPERLHDPTTVTPDAVRHVENGSGLDLLGGCKGCATTPTLPPPPPPTPPPLRLHAGMQPPVKIVNVDPIYPPMARTAHVKGVVILEAVIDERGVVASVKVLRSIQLLDQAAVDAVGKWRFTPARLNGEAVPVVMTVTVNFELDR